MIRLTSYLNGSPIYVPADVVIKENYEHEFGINYALPTAKYKPLGGAMVVYDGIEYAVKESQEEVARKVLEWRLTMERYRAYVYSAACEDEPQANEIWPLVHNAESKLMKLAGLEEQKDATS